MRACSLVIVLILLGMLAGCACSTGYNTSLVAQEWGTSYRLAVANQALNPDAEKNLKPVSGMDNGAAERVITQYHKDFEKAPQVPIYSISMPGTLGTVSTGVRY